MSQLIVQQFGDLVPGVVDAHADTDGYQIYAKVTIFETVDLGAYARLPESGASSVQLVVWNNGANTLEVRPPPGGRINSLAIDEAYDVDAAAIVAFYCFDPVMDSGMNWYASAFGGIAPNSSLNTLALTNVDADGEFVTMPAGSVLLQILLIETAGVTVQPVLGTTDGASDVMPTVTVSGFTSLPVGQLSLAIAAFAVDQDIFLSAPVWGGAVLNMKVWYLV
jgi:hypothetical protein